MPAIKLVDLGSMVKNIEGERGTQGRGANDSGPMSVRNCALPSDDSAAFPRGIVGDGARAGMTSKMGDMGDPIEFVSLPTMVTDAPLNPQTWNSGDKGEDWMGTDAYISGTAGLTGLKGATKPITAPSNKRAWNPGR